MHVLKIVRRALFERQIKISQDPLLSLIKVFVDLSAIVAQVFVQRELYESLHYQKNKRHESVL